MTAAEEALLQAVGELQSHMATLISRHDELERRLNGASGFLTSNAVDHEKRIERLEMKNFGRPGQPRPARSEGDCADGPQILNLDPHRELNVTELSVEEATTHIQLIPEEPLVEPTGQLPPSPMDVNNSAGFKPNRVNG